MLCILYLYAVCAGLMFRYFRFVLQELITVTPNERNWRGICIALLVIVAVLGLILLFIVLLSPPFQGHSSRGAKFTLEHIAGSHFKTPPLNGSWVSGT